MKKYTFLLLLLAVAFNMQAQALNANVRINAQKATNIDPAVFQTLENAVKEFLNEQKWTDDEFEPEERINANFIITVQEEQSPTEFKVDIAVQSSRPIFDSDQETPLLNHVDKGVVFSYEQFQPLNFSNNNFNSNLTHVLAFYVYIMLGMDYDSFAPLGGDDYFQSAQELINNIPSNAQAAYKGWQSLDGNQNRFWIAENFLSPRMRPFRNAWYQYHRLGLDRMSEDVVEARVSIAEVIQTAEQVNQSYPNSNVMQLFLNAKRQEVIEIFKRGLQPEKNSFVQSMMRIDPSNSAQYRAVR